MCFAGLLTSPAWACDMGELFYFLIVLIAGGSALCSTFAGLLGWALRSTPLPSPLANLFFATLGGTIVGTGAGFVSGSSGGPEFLWITALASTLTSLSVVLLTPGPAGSVAGKVDQLLPNTPEPAPPIATEEWKTLS